MCVYACRAGSRVGNVVPVWGLHTGLGVTTPQPTSVQPHTHATTAPLLQRSNPQAVPAEHTHRARSHVLQVRRAGSAATRRDAGWRPAAGAHPPAAPRSAPCHPAPSRAHCSRCAAATRAPPAAGLHGIHVAPCRVVPQMHRLLLNNESTGLVSALLEGGTRTALHVAVERSNEAAVALLLAQCVLRARACTAAGRVLALASSTAPYVPRSVAARSHRAARRTPPRPTRTARARWS